MSSAFMKSRLNPPGHIKLSHDSTNCPNEVPVGRPASPFGQITRDGSSNSTATGRKNTAYGQKRTVEDVSDEELKSILAETATLKRFKSGTGTGPIVASVTGSGGQGALKLGGDSTLEPKAVGSGPGLNGGGATASGAINVNQNSIVSEAVDNFSMN